MKTTPPEERRRIIATAIHASDDVVLVLNYRDEWGRESERVVSPIRFIGPGRFLAFCLGREATRTFYIGRCVRVRFAAADEALAGSQPVKEKYPRPQ